MPTPTRVLVTEAKDAIKLEYGSDGQHKLPAEYLRVFSPSAEVRGHGRGQEVLQFGKLNVLIHSIEKAGNYALQITFDDGHNSGIFSWDYLFELGENYTDNWIGYLGRLHEAGESRDPETQVVRFSS